MVMRNELRACGTLVGQARDRAAAAGDRSRIRPCAGGRRLGAAAGAARGGAGAGAGLRAHCFDCPAQCDMDASAHVVGFCTPDNGTIEAKVRPVQLLIGKLDRIWPKRPASGRCYQSRTAARPQVRRVPVALSTEAMTICARGHRHSRNDCCQCISAAGLRS